jgi:hypothetical protein
MNDQTPELLEGKNVFDPIDRSTNQYLVGSAQYMGYIGHPPHITIQYSSISSLYSDPDGK